MKTNTAKILSRIKALLLAIKRQIGIPLHYNSLMILINWMPEFTGAKVDFALNDLDSDNTMRVVEKIIRKWLRKFPPEEPITKTYIAAFISSLSSNLVDKEETPIDFAEELFLRYYDPRKDKDL